jgi:hypothetical protein
MFSLGTPLKPNIHQHDKDKKHNSRRGEENAFSTDSDLIELVPRPHARQESCGDHQGDGEDPDKMIIHKEVRYSIQYEDGYDIEARRCAQDDSRKHCVDVSACV